MSEPKWWPKGEIPTEQGLYLSMREKGVDSHCSWRLPNEAASIALNDGRVRTFYGPIPDPPKEPPKLRRFTATHKTHGVVSGVYSPDEKPVISQHYVFFFNKLSNIAGDWVYAGELSDIVWLDKE